MDPSSIFACPRCKGPLSRGTEGFACGPCDVVYPIVDGIPVLLTGEIETDSYKEFWNEGWKSRVESDQLSFLRADGPTLRAKAEAWFAGVRRERQELLDLLPAGDALLLDIGCGVLEGTLLSLLGFHNLIAVDFSFAAVATTQDALRKIDASGITAQANAESLPFANDVVDAIYSVGVLHHTPHTEKAMAEVFRVLKPGGRAVIGLYTTYGFPHIHQKIKGWLRSLFHTGGGPWYRTSEGAWATRGQSNPHTRTFSRREIDRLFAPFPVARITVRKMNFDWSNAIPKLGRHLQRIAMMRELARLFDPLAGSMWMIAVTKE